MKGTLWNLNNEIGLVKDQPLTMGEGGDSPYVILSNGTDLAVGTEAFLKEHGEDVTETLRPQSWEHTTLLETSGSDEDLSQLVNLLMLQCMDITSRGVIPFELLPDDMDGNIKTHDVSLNDAHGYWTHAVAVLDTEDGEDEPKLVIKVMLSGMLFTGKFDDEGIVLSEDNVGDTLMVIPRFAQPDGEENKIDAVSFDVKLK